ncbi:MAG: hypothetical protein CVT48_01430 [Thermoplasmata archaeon HGW-Thermoplasmata-1]|nr:MAG: hypothetical protein CVT48_01430 [Thermoplasmata archaeon HGW-Thermoplasmata-1]
MAKESLFKVLANDTRLGILELLKQRSHSYTELMNSLGLNVETDRGKFTYHLNMLKDQQLIGQEGGSYAITPRGISAIELKEAESVRPAVAPDDKALGLEPHEEKEKGVAIPDEPPKTPAPDTSGERTDETPAAAAPDVPPVHIISHEASKRTAPSKEQPYVGDGRRKKKIARILVWVAAAIILGFIGFFLFVAFSPLNSADVVAAEEGWSKNTSLSGSGSSMLGINEWGRIGYVESDVDYPGILYIHSAKENLFNAYLAGDLASNRVHEIFDEMVDANGFTEVSSRAVATKTVSSGYSAMVVTATAKLARETTLLPIPGAPSQPYDADVSILCVTWQESVANTRIFAYGYAVTTSGNALYATENTMTWQELQTMAFGIST